MFFFSTKNSRYLTHVCILEVTVALRTEEESQKVLNDGFQQLFNGQESMNSMLNRKDSFTEAWEQVNKMITVGFS